MENKIVGLTRRTTSARNIRLFLDYDGTLAEFADSPDTILPDPALIKLMEQLVAADGILPAVISGRRLSHIRQLLPVAGLLLGGTYGVEMQLPTVANTPCCISTGPPDAGPAAAALAGIDRKPLWILSGG